ncbi:MULTISPECIES: membrane protein insertase YidC [Vagococcus]|uniref:Membrane protein insertase YidC n=1 Tax=Vagococcus fluvialis bH819 TaxID=1255619 RepID=A0A1X6WRB9_9ENTE|nr:MULTISPECIES: membrane protein insertase YidC [Vagococcus]SLM86798.1 Inner membrane protein translocase component YidC, OxaA protein [Vagococcus fluvialis bH819]HCM88743.1 membrane protein insertase YidC [Vagococcus sp.]
MRRLKRWMITSSLFGLLLFLSGCVKTDKTGNPTGDGFVYNFLVKPMSNMITFLAEDWGLGFGLAIILLTVVVRLIIMPLGLSQMKKSMVQQEKMASVKPYTDEINKRMKAATSNEEKMQAQTELQQLYKDNNINLMGGMGCLPLLIQMPIFTALFFAAKFTPGINGTIFLGINLGKPSMLLVALAGISYFAQSYISMIGMNEEQKKQMKMMSYMSPIMIIMFSISAPAGVTLYWVIGGIFSCIQSLITNLYHKPKIKADLAEQLEKNPIKVVKPKVKDVTPQAKQKPTNKNNSKNKNAKGRNAGKQQNK